jgi:large subunit ribosomal protein L11
LLVYAGVAKPSPKMGQALGPLGLNMMQFCKVNQFKQSKSKDFNAQTGHIRPDVPMRVVLVGNKYPFLMKFQLFLTELSNSW